MRFVFQNKEIGKQFAAAADEHKKIITDAAVAALKEVTQVALTEGRANIASAGKFGPRWTKGFTSRFYKNDGLDAASLIYHKIGYAGIFEEGGSIVGKPLLWLPLRKVPKRPRDFHGKLASVNHPGKRPLLVGNVDGKRIPLFVGIDIARIRRRFNLVAIIRRAADRFGEFYLKNLKVD